MLNVTYAIEPDVTPAEWVDVLNRATLAERRPLSNAERLQRILSNSDLIITARVDGLLVGVSRAITDFGYCTYLSDLAVDVAYQRQGIGRELIRRTHEAAGLDTQLILLAAPTAVDYYPHIGLERHDSCWTIPRRTS